MHIYLRKSFLQNDPDLIVDLILNPVHTTSTCETACYISGVRINLTAEGQRHTGLPGVLGE